MTLFRTLHASAHDIPLADGSVQCCVTSPPYWGLRRYAGEQGVAWPAVTYAPMPGLPLVTVPGCDPDCEHEWGDALPPRHPGQVPQTNMNGRGNAESVAAGQTAGQGAYCAKCGGWRGDLGLEPTVEAYIGHLILCLREWRRILREDGTICCNLGDSFQDKQLMGTPWRFAFAAQADGWWLRSDIIWAKPNPMPESVTDRPTKAHEYVFMLAKNQRYYWDADAVREDRTGDMDRPSFRGGAYIGGNKDNSTVGITTDIGNVHVSAAAGRNLRSVWTIATQPTGFAHFATFPEKLVEPCICAGTSARGACPHCGAPWRRVTERTNASNWAERAANGADSGSLVNGHNASHGNGVTHDLPTRETQTVGWQQSCTCAAADPVPCVVMDPFHGSGTTGVVALKLGRAYVGVDISEDYLQGVTAERIGGGVQIGLGV